MAGSRPGEGIPPGGAPRAPAGVPARRIYLDNLKVLLVAAVIAGHALIGYADVGDIWAYSNVREVTLSTPVFVVLLALVFPFVLFMIALLFLVAGLLTPGSVDRKGPARFARDRLVRLGVPYAAFTLLLAPALEYALYRPLGYETRSYWTEFVADFPVASVLWFAAVLLIFSLAYAAWRRLRPATTARSRPLTFRLLLVVAAAVGATTFVVRLAVPYGSYPVLGLHAWQWPECVALFAVGVTAARQDWSTAVPEAVRRRARRLTLLAAVVVALFVALPIGIPLDHIAGGPHWEALLIAFLEGVLTVFGPVWLLAVAQRHLDHPFPHGAALARSSYGAFVVQGVCLFGFAVALRPVPVPAEGKALTLAVLSVLGSYCLSWLLITRVPPLGRVL